MSTKAPSPAVATIVIAAYRAEATLERAIRSASAQTVPVEIVIVDDGSDDGTYAIAEACRQQDPQISAFRMAQNAGPAAARNRGIAESSAPWIAVLDADDHMAPDRIERLVAEAEAQELDFLADDLYRVTDADLWATDNRLWSASDIGQTDITFAAFVEGNRRNRYGQRGELGFVKPLMRRAFLEAHDLSYDPALRLAEDYLLYAKALAAGARFRLVDPRGYFAVYRGDSLSSQHSTRDLGAIVEADRALATHPDLTPEDLVNLRLHRLDVHKEWAWRRLIDAVHQRDLRTMLGLVVEPPAVVFSLLQKLVEQVAIRSLRTVKRVLGTKASSSF